KSGSTWLAFMLGEFLTGVSIDFVNQREHMPAVGAQPKHEGILPEGGWLLRSHEPAKAEYGKSVYLVRHVADVAGSYFNYLKLFGIHESPKEFLPAFLLGHLDGYGSWAEHVHSWLDRRGDTLVVRYEDLRADPETVLGRVVAFLGVDADPGKVEHVVRSNT